MIRWILAIVLLALASSKFIDFGPHGHSGRGTLEFGSDSKLVGLPISSLVGVVEGLAAAILLTRGARWGVIVAIVLFIGINIYLMAHMITGKSIEHCGCFGNLRSSEYGHIVVAMSVLCLSIGALPTPSSR